MKKIELIKTSDGWMAKFSEPRVRELFGTDTILTPFTELVEGMIVLNEIRKRNPDCEVKFAEG